MSAAEAIDILYGPPLDIISQCLRGFLVPSPGHDFIACDFAGIESRVLNWLAGEKKHLDLYRSGADVYIHNAANIYGIERKDVTKDQRQIGKVAELALGFQGGVRAFQTMGKNYGVRLPDKQAEAVKVAWREDHPKVVGLWGSLGEGAQQAVRRSGEMVRVGKLAYRKSGSFLFCRLPGGGCLSYPYPEIQQIETPWGEMRPGLTYMGVDALTKKWARQKAYGGLLCENVVQATARDLLAAAMFRLERAGYPIVMHVHDEVVCEVPKGFGSVEEVEKIMCELPNWAEGLPIAAKGWRGKRYRKD